MALLSSLLQYPAASYSLMSEISTGSLLVLMETGSPGLRIPLEIEKAWRSNCEINYQSLTQS